MLQRFDHRDFPLDRLIAAKRGRAVSACLPAREEAATIGAIVESLVPLREAGLLDEIVVVDDASSDGTARIARDAGADVHDQSALLPAYGRVQGKGDGMWRALSVLRGDVVCFADADSEDFGEHFVRGLVGPLLTESRLEFVKAAYQRPFKADGVTLPDGGGRVNELMARPLLRRFHPELAAFRQPLAGEFAARRELLEALPFATGYSVEIAMLIDAYELAGIGAMAEADLGSRQNRHQPLSALGPMADAVLAAVATRLVRAGRLAPGQFEPVPGERPPLASLRRAA